MTDEPLDPDLAPHVRRPILRDSECRAIALALAEGSGAAGFSEGDLADLLEFAEQTRIAGQLLKGVKDGRVLVRRGPDGEWQWRANPQPPRQLR